MQENLNLFHGCFIQRFKMRIKFTLAFALTVPLKWRGFAFKSNIKVLESLRVIVVFCL